MQDENFIHSMNPFELDGRRGFVGVVQNFLGNRKAANFVQVVQSMLDAYQRLGANMSAKLHFLHTISNGFLPTVATLATSKVNASTKILKKWKQDIKEDGTLE